MNAAIIAANGWRVWVEYKDTGKRIFESKSEKQHAAAVAAFMGASNGR